MSQWIIAKGFVEEITLGLKGKQLCFAKGHTEQIVFDWMENF